MTVSGSASSGLSAVRSVPLTSLLPSDSPRLSAEDAAHVALLAQSSLDSEPIVVHRESMRIVDGMHRLRAAQVRGQHDIEVVFFDGGADDAFVLAVELNIRHGLPLTLQERRAAAERILVSHPHWSDRGIAARTGVSAKSVRVLRARATADVPQSAARMGRDGRLRPVDPQAGRARVACLLRERPQASLREIARVAGVSPSTVRSVREGLSPGPATGRLERGGPASGAVALLLPPLRAGRSAVQRLVRDPALRSTDQGRHLLRLLTARDEARWGGLPAIVPGHLRQLVRQAALEEAEAWSRLADLLEQGRREAG